MRSFNCAWFQFWQVRAGNNWAASMIVFPWNSLEGRPESIKCYLVGDGTIIIELLEHPGVGEGGVPLGDMVSVTDGLYHKFGRHLNLGLAPVDLPATRVLATFDNITLAKSKDSIQQSALFCTTLLTVFLSAFSSFQPSSRWMVSQASSHALSTMANNSWS